MKRTKAWLIILAMMLTLFMASGCGEEKKDNKSDADNDSLAKVEDVLDNETDESVDDETDKESESGDGDIEPSGESDTSLDGETESSEEETTSNSQSSDESVRPTGPDTTVDEDDISSGSPEDITTDKQETTTTKKQETTTTKKQETTTTKKPETTTTTTAKPTTTTKAPSGNDDTNVNYGAIINKGSEDYLERYSKRGVTATEIAKAETILNSILKTSMSEVERVRAIHDWLVKNVNYDYDTANDMNGITGEEDAFSATGSLINKLAVCEGYSEGFLLLCWTAGIDAMLVEGTAGGGGHEWNVVNIDGSWYQVDVTWDDPGIGEGVNDTTGNNLRYDYFLITTADMQADHVISSCFDYEASSWCGSVPSCTSKAFYDYAEQCTLEHQLSGSEYAIVTSYDEVESATKSYLSKGITAFKILYEVGTLDESTVLDKMGKAASNYYGVGISYSYYSGIQASGYTIVEITSITKG